MPFSDIPDDPLPDVNYPDPLKSIQGEDQSLIGSSYNQVSSYVPEFIKESGRSLYEGPRARVNHLANETSEFYHDPSAYVGLGAASTLDPISAVTGGEANLGTIPDAVRTMYQSRLGTQDLPQDVDKYYNAEREAQHNFQSQYPESAQTIGSLMEGSLSKPNGLIGNENVSPEVRKSISNAVKDFPKNEEGSLKISNSIEGPFDDILDDAIDQKKTPSDFMRGREADFVSNRLRQVHEQPILGGFDVDHLRAIHSHIFQDFPDFRPGTIRGDTPNWVKDRKLEGIQGVYQVPYMSQGIETQIKSILNKLEAPKTIKGISPDLASEKIAKLYADLDHAHAFHEGNSRTLREFTRQLADESGYNLDWSPMNLDEKARNQLYLARDLAVLQRVHPDLTLEKGMKSLDRAEYEASLDLENLRQAVGEKSLNRIIRNSLTRKPQ